MLHKGVLYIKQEIFGAPCRNLREPQESSREPWVPQLQLMSSPNQYEVMLVERYWLRP